MVLPANLLNDGTYTVSIQAVQDTLTSLYLHPEVLVFEVNDTPRIGNWHGKWPGVIRPKLNWNSQDLIENEFLMSQSPLWTVAKISRQRQMKTGESE